LRTEFQCDPKLKQACIKFYPFIYTDGQSGCKNRVDRTTGENGL